jgi:hypothetical protein
MTDLDFKLFWKQFLLKQIFIFEISLNVLVLLIPYMTHFIGKNLTSQYRNFLQFLTQGPILTKMAQKCFFSNILIYIFLVHKFIWTCKVLKSTQNCVTLLCTYTTFAKKQGAGFVRPRRSVDFLSIRQISSIVYLFFRAHR